MKQIISAKRILIVGDAGRGKTTLAQKLSRKLGVPSYSTDDFFWKIKFSEKQDREKSIESIKREVYSRNMWIVEGSTRLLIEPGFKDADLIIYLAFRSVLSQWLAIIKRHKTRDNESFFDLVKLLRHVLYKRHNLGYQKFEPKMLNLIEPYKDKVLVLHSFKEINKVMGG